jgi:predicted MFS family arabinose efflux permease
LILPSTPPSLPLGLLVFSVWVFGTWFGLPAQQSIAAGLNARARGTIMAFNSSAFNLGAVLSPAIAGTVYSAGGFPLLGTWTAGLAAVAFVIALVLLPRTRPAQAPVPAIAPAPDARFADCAPV